MLLTLEPGDDIAALVRGAEAGSIIVLISASLDALSTSKARASIGPLAIELAPGQRLNAVCPAASAKSDDVAAAVAFLEQARSTTGQLLDIA